MKVFAISDLHLSTTTNKPMDVFGGGWENHFQKICADWNKKVGKDDVVLIAGDISWALKKEDAKPDLDEISKLVGKKIIIKGNHELWWQSISSVRDMLSGDFFALQNDSIRFDNILVCGTRGWAPAEKNNTLSKENLKIYKREIERLKLTLADMQKKRKDGDFVICMTHFPPFNFAREDNEFTALLEEFGVNACVFGHIHSEYTRGKFLQFERNGVAYYQTSCDQVNFELVEIKTK